MYRSNGLTRKTSVLCGAIMLLSVLYSGMSRAVEWDLGFDLTMPAAEWSNDHPGLYEIARPGNVDPEIPALFLSVYGDRRGRVEKDGAYGLTVRRAVVSTRYEDYTADNTAYAIELGWRREVRRRGRNYVRAGMSGGISLNKLSWEGASWEKNFVLSPELDYVAAIAKNWGVVAGARGVIYLASGDTTYPLKSGLVLSLGVRFAPL